MFTERFAIQQRMQEIKDERRALHDEYYKLLDRLREIDSEPQAQNCDLVNTFGGLTEELTKAIQMVSQLVPQVSVGQVIENLIETTSIAEQVIAEEEPQQTETQARVKKAVQQAHIAIEASDDAMVKIKPKKAEPIVLNILREEGIPLTPAVIYEKMNERGYEMNTAIHEIIRRLHIADKIESPTYGFWQPKRA